MFNRHLKHRDINELPIADCQLPIGVRPQSAIGNWQSAILLVLLAIGGCTYNSSNTTPDAADRQHKQADALHDAMNYKSDESTQSYDISGGGIIIF